MTHRWAALALISAVPAAPAAAKEPLRLAPSSKWHVNYAPDSWGPEDAEALIARDGRNWVTLPQAHEK